jgi:DNA-binding response OmpR family regulator
MSSSPPHHDELITKLQLQAMTEHEYGMQQKQQQKLQEEETEELYNQKRNEILLVDDEPDTCMLYQIVLQDAGYECMSYTDPVKALQDFRPYYYNLILLDIKMPILNGFELCKKIREVDKAVHIVFITASEEYYEKFRRQSYPELNNDSNISYIQKPIGNEELLQLVNILIATSHIK